VAKVAYKMPEEFLLKVSQLGEKTDEILPRVLKAGGEVVEEKVKRDLESIIGSGTKEESRSTGELLSSLGVSSAKQDRNGNFNVKPRKDGKSNAMIASVLEYGKSGQLPKPFLKPAKAASKTACTRAMISALEKEVENL
jgi:HK97 gp10 family phage protein